MPVVYLLAQAVNALAQRLLGRAVPPARWDTTAGAVVFRDPPPWDREW